MADPDSIPTGTWPPDLIELWHTCAQRGEVEASNPPTLVVEAYLQVAEARVRRLAGIPWGDGTQHGLVDDDEELLSANLRRTLAISALGVGQPTWSTSIPLNGLARFSARRAISDERS